MFSANLHLTIWQCATMGPSFGIRAAVLFHGAWLTSINRLAVPSMCFPLVVACQSCVNEDGLRAEQFSHPAGAEPRDEGAGPCVQNGGRPRICQQHFIIGWVVRDVEGQEDQSECFLGSVGQ